MIHPRDIRELLDKAPFEPFRISMSDGHAYEVVDPDLVVPMATKLFLALPDDRWKFLSYQNITAIDGGAVAA
ncbi:MAG TPA: hypothetical protein VFC78_10870 [Tepidisphaeraceae bacterium]|nr:hypothetical protein [Tepidisphaeraceae bacterium]